MQLPRLEMRAQYRYEGGKQKGGCHPIGMFMEMNKFATQDSGRAPTRMNDIEVVVRGDYRHPSIFQFNHLTLFR